MNKLLTYKGGQPVYLEDLDFIQKSIGGAFEKFVKALTDSGDTGDPIVLSGLDRFGTYGFNSGVIAFGGRIFYVDGHEDIDDGKHFINFITKEGEPRRLKNGSTVNVYKYEEAVWDSTGWNYDDLYWINDELASRLKDSLVPKIYQAIKSRIDDDAIVFNITPDTTGKSYAGGILTRIRGGRYLYQGKIYVGEGGTAEWYSDNIIVSGPSLPPVAVSVPMCCRESIIPGSVSVTGKVLKVEFWGENAIVGGVYNFTVMI